MCSRLPLCRIACSGASLRSACGGRQGPVTHPDGTPTAGPDACLLASNGSRRPVSTPAGQPHAGAAPALGWPLDWTPMHLSSSCDQRFARHEVPCPRRLTCVVRHEICSRQRLVARRKEDEIGASRAGSRALFHHHAERASTRVTLSVPRANERSRSPHSWRSAASGAARRADGW